VRRGLSAAGASVLMAMVTAAPSAAAPAGSAGTTWYWTSQRAELRVLAKLGVPASCRGVGEMRNGAPVALVHDRRFACQAPRLDGTVWRFTLEVRGQHRFELTPAQAGAGQAAAQM